MNNGNSSKDDVHEEDVEHGIKFKDWGFKIDRLFEVAYRFYKRNEGKVFHPSFDVRNQMNALILQSKFGNFDNNKSPDIGVLDLIGKGRRHQWSLLKGMSKAEAMSKFICTLDEMCPFFKAHAEAVKISAENQLSMIPDNHHSNSIDESMKQIESDEQLQAIHTSLCRQTYDQFRCYAEKQHPNDIPKQKYLISEMQKQYCEKYISQIHPDAGKNLKTPSSGGSPSHLSPSPEQPEDPSFMKRDVQVVEQVQETPEIVNAKFEPFPEPSEIKRPSAPRLSNLDNNFAIMSSNKQMNQENDTSLYKSRLSDYTSITIPSESSSPPSQPSIVSQAVPISPHEITSLQEPVPSGNIIVEETHETDENQVNLELSSQRKVDTWSCGSSSGTSSPLQQNITYEPLEPATIWTKKSVNEFKASLTDDKHGGLYTVKQGTTLIIQVPTYPDGRYIYWEFTTDEFDIGFGLDFIYETNLIKPLALKIYEEINDDDDDDDDDIDNLNLAIESTNLNEKNTTATDILERNRIEKAERAARTISILPTYRRDSHEEVFVGRHRYPGQGYYLLKFDNTYSVLRSKSMFFRICYFI